MSSKRHLQNCEIGGITYQKQLPATRIMSLTLTNGAASLTFVPRDMPEPRLTAALPAPRDGSSAATVRKQPLPETNAMPATKKLQHQHIQPHLMLKRLQRLLQRRQTLLHLRQYLQSQRNVPKQMFVHPHQGQYLARQLPLRLLLLQSQRQFTNLHFSFGKTGISISDQQCRNQLRQSISVRLYLLLRILAAFRSKNPGFSSGVFITCKIRLESFSI